MDLTTTDKYLMGGGAVLAVVGGLLWYKNSQKNKQDEPAGDQTYVDAGTGGNTTSDTPKKLPAGTTKAQQEVIAVISAPDGAAYKIGDKVMGNVRPDFPYQDVFKDANGSYFTKGKNVGRIPYGELIGTIIWTGTNKITKQHKYVVQADSQTLIRVPFLTDAYQKFWVSHKNIALVNAKKPGLSTGLIAGPVFLRKGSIGKDVEVLQKNLGFVTREFALKSRFSAALKIIDGDFGQKTEDALFKKYGVKSITLSQLK